MTIINIHPNEIPSVTGAKIISDLQTRNQAQVVKPEDKTTEEWRALIDSGEKLVLVAPVYWWGLSYEFDKWFQNVFNSGWAYDYTKNPTGLLQGKSIEVHLTHGTPAEYSQKMMQNIKERLELGVFGYCGIDTTIEFHHAQG